jgi:hypothetical protein
MTPSDAFFVLTAIKPNNERASSIPKPMAAGCRYQRQPFASKGSIQVHPADVLHEFLFQKPLLNPHECGIIILDGDHHRRLRDCPPPEPLWYFAQIDSDSADEHQQHSTGSKLVLRTEKFSYQFQHSSAFLTGS